MDAIKKNKRLTPKLAAATLSLFGAATAASAGEFESLEVDTSILFYQESDSRVTAFEPILNIQKEFSGDRFANVKLVLDALTGATPNGATPSNTAQTFTRPSGNGEYTVSTGETPLDDTFLDTRVGLSGSWTQPLDRLTKATIGLNVSVEFDFRSVGLNTSVSRDFNQRNTTLTFGLAGEFDTINPIGGIPNPLNPMLTLNQAKPARQSEETRTVLDAIFGLTQVINRKTLMQFNYSLSQSSGYHTDPFKLVSRIDEARAVSDPDFLTYIYENRPDSRMRQSLYWLTRYHLARDILGASYRFYTDDWGILSHTLDLTYRWKFKEKHFLEPHIRYYQQTEADFYRVGVRPGAIPTEVSADYRLAAFTGITLGFSYGWDFRDESSLLVRLEYYMQNGDASHDTAIGFQKNQDVFPDMQATIIQIQYSF